METPLTSTSQIKLALQAGTHSVDDFVKAAQTVINENSHLNAVIELYDDVTEDIARAEKLLQNNEGSALTGVPVLIKDNLCVTNRAATAGSQMLAGYKAPYTATAVKKLQEAGAIIIGRTNMDEFAMGSSNESSFYGPVKNPLDTTRVPGGSSGGSAAAVAAGFTPIALGSDTGGSVRQPAAFCGVVGFKPTYGHISRHGLMAMGSSLDQIGIFGHTTTEVLDTYDVIAGEDALDATTTSQLVIDTPAKKVRTVATIKEITQNLSPDNKAAQDKAIAQLKSNDIAVTEVSIPSIEDALAIYYIIMPAEVSSNLARYDGVRYPFRTPEPKNLAALYNNSRTTGFGAEATRRIILGTYLLSAGYSSDLYRRAIAAREHLKAEFKAAFTQADILLTPTTPTPAFKLNATQTPLEMYLADTYTVPANIAGLPAISVPYSEVELEGTTLPLSIHLTGSWHDDRTVLETAKLFKE